MATEQDFGPALCIKAAGVESGIHLRIGFSADPPISPYLGFQKLCFSFCSHGASSEMGTSYTPSGLSLAYFPAVITIRNEGCFIVV